jgi:hypothetical protein
MSVILENGGLFDRDTILFDAAPYLNTYVGLLQVFCNAGANINAALGDETLLCWWIRKFEKVDCCGLLVAANALGADLDASATVQEPKTPLMCAVSYFNLKHVQTLLELGARTDIVHERAWDALLERYTPPQMLAAATRVSVAAGVKRSFRPFYREREWIPPLLTSDVDAALLMLGGEREEVDVNELAAALAQLNADVIF